MPERNSLLERMRVASPCRAAWESMEGGERVRFCRECSLHVYNISEMTRGEAEALLAGAGGRLCARLYRRADGTVITKDCPVGWRALRRRVTRRAGAALAAVLALAGGAFGQKQGRDGAQPPPQQTCAGGATYELKRGRTEAKDAAFSGLVRDPNGAVIAGADVFLFGGKKMERRYVAGTSDEGLFQFKPVPRGEYLVEIYAHGFSRFQLFGVAFDAGETIEISVVLPVAPEEPLTGIVNVIPDEPLLDTGPGLKHVFKREQIKRLPN